MPKEVLYLQEQDLSAEVFDFQTCRDGTSDEFVVRFGFFIYGLLENIEIF